MKKTSLFVMLLGLLLTTGIIFAKDNCCSPKAINTSTVATAKKNTIFTYSFSEKPKIGTSVFMLKLKDPKNFTGKIEAQYGMPSMSGAHDSGWAPLVKNKKGLYVAPISFVMPGIWQIDIRITEGETINEYKVIVTI